MELNELSEISLNEDRHTAQPISSSYDGKIHRLVASLNPNGNTTNKSFSKAKKRLLKNVYYDHQTTFYCDCEFTLGKKIIPSEKYTPKKDNVRSKRIEWEQVVPAHALNSGDTEFEFRGHHT